MRKCICVRKYFAAAAIIMAAAGVYGETELEQLLQQVDVGAVVENVQQAVVNGGIPPDVVVKYQQVARELLDSFDMTGAQLGRDLKLKPEDLAEGLPLALKVWEIIQRVCVRREKYLAELKKKGIEELKATVATAGYKLNIGNLGNLMIDDWGGICLDRRFVTKEEMKDVKKLEGFVQEKIPEVKQEVKARPPRKSAGAGGAPIFFGFEAARYQQHDAIIVRLVKDFNANKAKWCGGTPAQAAKIADVTVAMVKAHMIEETGGNDSRSKAAWAADPLQVNVPGDWGVEKELVGLKKPQKRNEGDVENNVRAAIMYLSRKGFSAAARPAAERPKGFFDGWERALQRYNGRRDRTDSDRYYSDEYAEKIMKRANNPSVFVPIEIKVKKG